MLQLSGMGEWVTASHKNAYYYVTTPVECQGVRNAAKSCTRLHNLCKFIKITPGLCLDYTYITPDRLLKITKSRLQITRKDYWKLSHDHMIDYWRLRTCINKIKITDYKGITGQAYKITAMLQAPRTMLNDMRKL